MKYLLRRPAALLVLTILFSCNTRPNSNEMAMEVSEARLATEQQATENKTAAPVERKLIKTGEIVFETTSLKETKVLITNSMSELDGYIANDNLFESEGKISHRLVIRVPADKFDQLLNKISESADKLDSKSIDVQDVTEEYIDVEARIKTKKELESRYKELLQQAKNVEEILSIEKEIGTLRTEIESMEGRLRYLKDQVGFSTLTVEYYQRTSAAFGFSAKLSRALGEGWDLLMVFVIGITHLWTFILLAVSGIFVYRRYKRARTDKGGA